MGWSLRTNGWWAYGIEGSANDGLFPLLSMTVASVLKLAFCLGGKGAQGGFSSA